MIIRDFAAELAKVSWTGLDWTGLHWTLAEADRGIEHHVDQFKDISNEVGDDLAFMLFNPNVS